MPLQLHPPPSDQTLCTGEAGLRRRQQRPCRAPRPTTVHVLLTVSTVTWGGHSPFVPTSILHSSCPEVELYRLYHMGSLANRQLNRRLGARGEREVAFVPSTLLSIPSLPGCSFAGKSLPLTTVAGGISSPTATLGSCHAILSLWPSSLKAITFPECFTSLCWCP